jgi:hypothetical protein
LFYCSICRINVLYLFLYCRRLLFQDSVLALESNSLNHPFSVGAIRFCFPKVIWLFLLLVFFRPSPCFLQNVVSPSFVWPSICGT